jgi:hypothetical protein
MAGSQARELLLARARSAQPEGTVEEYRDEDTGPKDVARVSRSGYGTVPVYVLTSTGVTRRRINVQSIAEVLNHPDFAAECFDCGRSDCPAEEINGCTGRPPRQFRICPVNSCKKRIYDPMPTGRFKVDEFDHSQRDDSDDPNVIRDDTYSGASTPASRTKTMMDLHIIGNHPATAMEMGIGRPAEMPRLAVVS